MREILFRGKEIDNGKWVEGYLVKQYGATEIYLPNGTDNKGFDRYHVNPETVGQYIGATDKNGKKIFEGDIIREYGGEFAQGYYEIDRRLIVEIPNTLVNIVLGCDCGCNYEIIGNIHDNPEMIGGVEE